jgi:RNA polymerase sigma-70 factor (ECF subfamily)
VLTATAADFRNLGDAALAQHIAAGNTMALEALMRRYNRPLYRAARSILKDDAEAEDVVQETYIQAYKTISGFRGDARLSTWLTRIAINLALARARTYRRRAEIIALGGDAAPRPESVEDLPMPEDVAEAPESAALRAEVRRLIERRIDGLPAVYRSVFVLRALEEMTVEETAACLGVPEATVRTRYFRARGLLREALASEIDFHLESAFGFDGARCDRLVARVLARLQNSAAGGP